MMGFIREREPGKVLQVVEQFERNPFHLLSPLPDPLPGFLPNRGER